MTSNVLCRYYAQGACAFGDKCRFSHNKEQDEPSQVCRYYLAGNCAYGDKCRYQHSKPGWSGKGQPAPPSNYTAPSGVPRPPTGGSGSGGNMVKLPSGASEFGMVEAAPNWDDYMTPDEMDEFEQWQTDQAMAAANRGSGQQAGGDYGDEGDIMDPADIPLCNEYAATGECSAGEECCYIHGDVCEICGYYCIHPYNPDVTQHHQVVCSEAMAAAEAAEGADAEAGADAGEHVANSCNGTTGAAAEAAGSDQDTLAAAAAAADKDSADKAEAAADAAAEDKASSEKEQENGGGAGDSTAADVADAARADAEGDAAAADKLADKLADSKVDS